MPAVTQLALHNKDQQLVYFNSDKSAVGQIVLGQAEKSSLTGFFKLNRDNTVGADGRRARTLLYEDLPTYFWWNKAKKDWIPRTSKDKAVGRIFSVSYLAGEQFYLRVLLLNQRNMQSFDHLKLVGDTMHKKYQDACNDLGLLVNKFLYNQTLRKATLTRPGFHVCQLFAMMCVHTPPSNPKFLFESHFEAFTNDFPRIDMSNRNSWMFTLEVRQILAFVWLSSMLVDLGKTLQLVGLTVTPEEEAIISELTMSNKGSEDPTVIAERLAASMVLFNKEQEILFNDVMQSLLRNKGILFYVDGLGGSNTTFLLNALIDFLYTRYFPWLVVALSGVALLLLKGGRTAHSTFKIPIPCNSTAHCLIKPNTELVSVMRLARFIIWDEVDTVHMNAINLVDATLRELCGSKEPFGGKVVVFAGDFCQTLPVVKYDKYPPSHEAKIKSLSLWTTIKKHALTVNMRLSKQLAGSEAKRNAKFASCHLILGEGKNQTEDFGLTGLRGVNLTPQTVHMNLKVC
jgi:hypothetical protein